MNQTEEEHRRIEALLDQGEAQEALTHCQKLARSNGNLSDPVTWLWIGRVCQRLGRLAEAQDAIEKSIACQADCAQAHHELGLALAAQKKGREAFAAQRDALRLQPNYPEAEHALGVACLALRRRQDALQHFRCAVQLRPSFPDPHLQIAGLLELEARPEEAILAYREYVQLRPDHADAHNSLGILLARQRCFGEAMTHFQTFLQLEPKRAAGQHNLAVAYVDQERIAEALPHFDEAIGLDNSHAEAHKGRGMALLKLGRFAEGWPEYEWRWRCRDLQPLRSSRPMWHGEPLAGKTILLHSEQGQGDTFQFIRYASLVKARGAVVVVACPHALLPMLRTCSGIDRLVSLKGPLPPHDFHCPLLSVPGIVGTDLATIPANVPYLYAEPSRQQAWQREFADVADFKIGIVWQGNPKYVNDANRSLPLAQFEPLTKIPNVRLFSLQIGKEAEQLMQATGKFEVTDLGQRIQGAWTETAAIMKNLDLVVICDTAVAHLAGALGVPAWVLLPFAADWRWLQERDDTPWYPTMRLFRQRQAGDWTEVFARIANALPTEQARPRVVPNTQVADLQYRYNEYPENDENRAAADAPVIVPAEPMVPSGEVSARLAVPQPPQPLAPPIVAAIKLAQARKFNEAEQSLQKFLTEQPESADGWFHLGLVNQSLNHLAEAVTCLRRSLRIRPEQADAHASLGIILCRMKQSREGEAALREAIRLQPNFAKAHNNLGAVLAELGKRDEALACWQETVRCDPNYPEGHFNLAVGLGERRQFDEAAQHYERALQLRPDYAEAYSNLGLLHVEQGRPGDAVILLEHAARLKPSFVDAHNNLGLALADLGRSEEALVCYRKALSLRPNYAEVYNNMGTAMAALGRPDEALSCFAQALRFKPGYPEAHWHQALTWLHEGDFVHGWPEYEYRWKRKRSRPRRFKEPLWDGGDLDGKTILLWCEQGLGDSLEFIRYAQMVKAKGGTVIVECPEKLRTLFTTCAGIDQLVVERTPLPPFDVQCPLLTLPGIFGTRLDTVPADIPYLSADPARIEQWRTAFEADGSSKKLRIGISWQGNPKHRWDRHRSFALEYFQNLARLEGVQLYSLQKGVTSDDLNYFVRRHGMIDLSPRLDDFTDTAAAMKNLDLVITCDSSPAHLAGALGVPVWMPLSAMNDWRWLTRRDDAPWYPTMRLFRQKTLGEWGEVFSRIEAELVNLSDNRS